MILSLGVAFWLLQVGTILWRALHSLSVALSIFDSIESKGANMTQLGYCLTQLTQLTRLKRRHLGGLWVAFWVEVAGWRLVSGLSWGSFSG